MKRHPGITLVGIVLYALVSSGCGSPSQVDPPQTPAATSPPTTSPAEDGEADPTAEPTPVPPTSFDATGTITLAAKAANRSGLGYPVPPDRCHTGLSYDDIAIGTAITVRDGAGVIIGTSSIVSLELINTTVETMEDMSQWDSAKNPLQSEFPMVEVIKGNCQFSFDVTLPDADFYSFEISNRGAAVFSKGDLVDSGWNVPILL